MKLYRCPWCGKPAFTTKHRLRMGASPERNMFLRRIRSWRFHKTHEFDCEACGRGICIDRNLFTYFIAYLPYLVIILSFVLFGVIYKSLVGLLVGILSFSVLAPVVSILLILFYGPPVTRVIWNDDNNREVYQADLSFEIDINPKLKLNIERVYAIRLKNVDPFDVNKDFELVDDYIRDGAPVQIELGDFSYEMGLLQPENYEEKYFTIGTEFDVIDVEGNKISTGVITRFIEKEEKPQS